MGGNGSRWSVSPRSLPIWGCRLRRCISGVIGVWARSAIASVGTCATACPRSTAGWKGKPTDNPRHKIPTGLPHVRNLERRHPVAYLVSGGAELGNPGRVAARCATSVAASSVFLLLRFVWRSVPHVPSLGSLERQFLGDRRSVSQSAVREQLGALLAHHAEADDPPVPFRRGGCGTPLAPGAGPASRRPTS